MSDERERGEVRPADYIKRAKKTDGLEFPVDVSDWRNAQVIEARWRGARHILTCNRVDPVFSTFDGRRPNYHELSDMRVIVDAEGKVVPPEVTTEMVERFTREWHRAGSAEKPAGCLLPWYPRVHESLAAALGGADHD